MSFIAPGQVVWFEIATTEAEASRKFYTKLFGWSYEVDTDSSVDGRTYTRITASGAAWPMGALTDYGTGSDGVNVSIFSADVAADTDRLAALGARVLVPATQVSDVTWFSVLADPAGNAFSLFQRGGGQRLAERAEATEQQISQTAFTPQPGSMAGFELGTTSPETTRRFYEQAFGWRFDGDDGRAVVFTGQQWPAGSMTRGEDFLIPCFMSSDVAATCAAAEHAGGKTVASPQTVPDGRTLAHISDPAGNRLAVISMHPGNHTPSV